MEQEEHPARRGGRMRNPTGGFGFLLMALSWIFLGGCASSSPDAVALESPAEAVERVRAPDAAPDELAAAMGELSQALARAESAVRASEAFDSETERARGYRFLLRSLIQTLEADLLQDADFPYFRVLDFWLRGGGDNPDQSYAFASIRGGVAYRVHGHLGSALRVELQLYAGQPWAGQGRTAGYLPFESIDIAPDGAFEIDVLPPGAESARGQVVNPTDATELFVRFIYDEWDTERTGEVHIDRVDWEGRRRPPATLADTAERIRRTARDLEMRARVWPAFVQRRYVDPRPPNTLSALIDTYALGGVRGRWMGGGYFELDEGEALLVKAWPTSAQYQSIQLADLFFDSLEYGNLVSSLNTTQSQRAPDGAYYFVIAPEDPGYANWLDTGGLARGVVMLRYDGVQRRIPEALHPFAESVEVETLPERIPGFRRTTESEREAVRATRREHLQIRSGR